MKSRGQSQLVQLFKFLSNYAFIDSDYSASFDYFVWEDRSGWNFRSVGLMAEEQNKKAADDEEQKVGFIVTTNVLNPNRILDIEVISEFNFQSLLDTGALISYYKRVDPVYDDPYADFTSINNSFRCCKEATTRKRKNTTAATTERRGTAEGTSAEAQKYCRRCC